MSSASLMKAYEIVEVSHAFGGFSTGFFMRPSRSIEIACQKSILFT